MKLLKELELEDILSHSYWPGCWLKKVLPLELKFGNLKGEFTSETTEIGIEVSYLTVFWKFFPFIK